MIIFNIWEHNPNGNQTTNQILSLGAHWVEYVESSVTATAATNSWLVCCHIQPLRHVLVFPCLCGTEKDLAKPELLRIPEISNEHLSISVNI